MWLKYTDTVTGYKYTFTFDGAEDVLVVKFANNGALSNGTWLHSKTLKSSRILEMQRIARKEHVTDRPEICEVARRTIDNMF